MELLLLTQDVCDGSKMVGGVQISLVLDVLSWRCQLDIQMKIASKK